MFIHAWDNLNFMEVMPHLLHVHLIKNFSNLTMNHSSERIFVVNANLKA